MTTLVIVLILLLIVAIFSVQNAFPVTITFMFWQFEASVAIVIFLSVLCGLIVGGVLGAMLRKRTPGKSAPKNNLKINM